MKTFGIGIPTVNRWDLLGPTMKKYQQDFTSDIFVWDNGNQGIVKETRFTLCTSEEPIGVAASWNQLCQLIFEHHTHALILNDDIYLGKTQRQIEDLMCYGNAPVFKQAMTGFSAFLLPRSVYNKVGSFDERFKGAYFEDRDYERRMRLAGYPVIKTSLLDAVEFNESSSIQKDPGLNINYQSNAAYYNRKWGGNLGGEAFTHPFNNLAYSA